MPETHGELGDLLCLEKIEKTKEEKQQEDCNKLAPLNHYWTLVFLALSW